MNLGDRLAYGQYVDLSYVDTDGLTNAQRIIRGLSPLDPNGIAYEVHHIGQQQGSPFAILTRDQHRGKGVFSILHFNTGDTESVIDREVFAQERQAFWMSYLNTFGGGL